MKERNTVTDRKILDVLAATSFERDTAIAKNNNVLAVKKEAEFKRLTKRAKKMGYSSNDIIKSDLFGHVNASMDAGDVFMERFFRAFLLELK